MDHDDKCRCTGCTTARVEAAHRDADNLGVPDSDDGRVAAVAAAVGVPIGPTITDREIRALVLVVRHRSVAAVAAAALDATADPDLRMECRDACASMIGELRVDAEHALPSTMRAASVRCLFARAAVN